MKTSDFDFDLPERFIAQNPVVPRDSSKLMHVSSSCTEIEDLVFSDLLDLLNAGDVLVLNNSRVIPARISFECNGKNCELFVLNLLGASRAKCLVRPGKLFKKSSVVAVSPGLSAEVVDVCEDGSRIVDFKGNFDLNACGEVPLPPYIKNSTSSADQYQTVYADKNGSVAAPTAGLHFTDRLLNELSVKGVDVRYVTLHVGRGTFLPVSSEFVEDHVMHSEHFELSEENADFLTNAKYEGRRIVAVGTTSVRVLESSFSSSASRFISGFGETDIFIRPGLYEWKVVDALVTNFHLPKSTLLMLLASFLEHKGCGSAVERVKELYEYAKSRGYRFYSFGDAMFIS